jgi:hypothetical protein
MTAAISIVLLSLFSTGAAAQTPPNDPLELQKRAVARIDSVIDRFRRTGDTRLQISELVQAGAELSASNRALAAAQSWSALAFGLIKQGHVHRLQGQWAEAIALYQGTQEAATRGRDVVRQSDALAWRALAESSRQNLGELMKRLIEFCLSARFESREMSKDCAHVTGPISGRHMGVDLFIKRHEPDRVLLAVQ